MRYPNCLLACLIFFTYTSGLSAQSTTPNIQAQSLFDGKTFAGWNGDTKNTWRIEDGTLIAGSMDTEAPRNEFLATHRSFDDFDLQLKFKIVGDHHINAGVQFRTRRIPNHHEV
ncbi:MAG: DUF1080 domain-containing protein, partial [Planctomycetota bacterium]